jgi:aminoglycoside phosphotransferase (APT) family kinase protein
VAQAREADRREALAEEWQRAFAWIEQTLGGRIVAFERQERWRPAWFLELERGRERLSLYFRGDRGETDHGVYGLERELRVLEVLEKRGIPVPHVYGFCPDPLGIVMARAPGRPNLATADSGAEREAVLEQYIDVLAAMHAIPLEAFEAIGFTRPESARELAFGDLDSWERGFRKQKRRPEPLIEFVLGWLRRNPPGERGDTTFLAGDSGQFLFEDARLTAVIDLELAYLGDPAADLAGLRTRDLSEPLGDLRGALRRYAERSGRTIDPAVVDYHTVRFAVCTPLAVAHLAAQPPPGVDFVQYLSWYLVYSRAPIEVIARRTGVALEPLTLPDSPLTRHAPAHDAMRAQLRALRKPGGYAAGVALRTAELLERAERLGPALESDDLEDAAALLGRRPKSWPESDAALETLVLESGAGREPEMLRYFQRRMLRQEAVVGPALRELEGVAIQSID